MSIRRTYIAWTVCLLVAVGSVGCRRPAGGPQAGADEATNPMRQADDPTGAMPPLSEAERWIIQHKGTERPFSGKYWDHFEAGAYRCRQCGAVLYLSDSKFRSDCGWPSFDDALPGAVARRVDADGVRTEILCAACGGHLGHVFLGEGFTPTDTRHCVNSASLMFVPASQLPVERAIFAGGCFWGVEHHFRQVAGVLATRAGYTGGTVERPSYEQVCTGRTGHAEAVEVFYDPRRVSYEDLARLFFEIHDPAQLNRQGPDVGSQYRSAVFVLNAAQRQTAESLIDLLRQRGYKVVTRIESASAFWPAEDCHQDYLTKHPDRPSCHVRVRRFRTPPATLPSQGR